VVLPPGRILKLPIRAENTVPGAASGSKQEE
jgi:hypothetical protein